VPFTESRLCTLQDGDFKSRNFGDVTFISPDAFCDQGFDGLRTVNGIEWRGYWGEWYRQSLRNAKNARLNQLSAYANADFFGQCANLLSACSNQATCSLQGCVPFSLQWSCMEPAFYSSGRSKLAYIFGSSRVSMC
jgi:hypothetical protein